MLAGQSEPRDFEQVVDDAGAALADWWQENRDPSTRLALGLRDSMAEVVLREAGYPELLAENKRLRELYENAVQNRDRFGWTIDHLLECDEALGAAQAELAKQEPVMVAADRIREAYEAMVEGRDIGRLAEWENA